MRKIVKWSIDYISNCRTFPNTHIYGETFVILTLVYTKLNWEFELGGCGGLLQPNLVVIKLGKLGNSLKNSKLKDAYLLLGMC